MESKEGGLFIEREKKKKKGEEKKEI